MSYDFSRSRATYARTRGNSIPFLWSFVRPQRSSSSKSFCSCSIERSAPPKRGSISSPTNLGTTCRWKWSTLCQAATPFADATFIPSADSRSTSRPLTCLTSSPTPLASSRVSSQMAPTWRMGTIRECPLAAELFAKKTMNCSSLARTADATLPVIISQNTQRTFLGCYSHAARRK